MAAGIKGAHKLEKWSALDFRFRNLDFGFKFLEDDALELGRFSNPKYKKSFRRYIIIKEWI
jgi:hypothetical protein